VQPLPSPASRLSRVPRMGRSGGDPARLSWWIRAPWSIRCTIDPPIHRQARINHLIQHTNPTKGANFPGGGCGSQLLPVPWTGAPSRTAR
jgi:hypothetical protein